MQRYVSILLLAAICAAATGTQCYGRRGQSARTLCYSVHLRSPLSWWTWCLQFFSVSHLLSHPQSASFEALSNYLNAYLQQPWQSLKCYGTLEHIVGKQIKTFA